MAPFQARFLPILFTLVVALGFVARPGAALQANPRAGNAPSTVALVDIAAQSNDTASHGRDPAIAVDPTNPSRIVVLSRTPSVNRQFPLWVSSDGGQNWVQHYSVPWPAGTILGTTQNIDFGQDGVLYGTFGTLNDAYTGTTTDPTQANSWSWNVTPTGTQVTNLGTPFQEEARLIAGFNPIDPTQSRAYVAYHEWSAIEQGIRVSISDSSEPPRFLVDNIAVPASVGGTGQFVPAGNPLLAQDPNTGAVYVFFEETRPRVNGGFNVTYRLNRSVDGGVSWGTTSSTNGVVVATRASDQGMGTKFGTVNVLNGGIHSVAVDPTTSNVCCVIGARDNFGNNRLQLVTLSDDGSGDLSPSAPSFVGVTGSGSGSVQAALPSVAVTDNGTIGVLYQTFDGQPNGFPQFTAHLATTRNQGRNWTDAVVLTYSSPVVDDGTTNQHVLGDREELRALGNTFYGVLVGNATALGGAKDSIDPIFFSSQAATFPRVQFDAPNFTVNETDGTATITVTRTGPTTNPCTVDFATSNGTATDGVNYLGTKGTLTFKAGETSETFPIPLLSNNTLDGNLTINLALTNSQNADLGIPTSATVTINDDILSVAPSQLTAQVIGGTKVLVQWIDNCANEDGFLLERKIDLGPFQLAGSVAAAAGVGSQVSLIDDGLTPGLTYTYRVRAFKFGENSGYSNTASATITGIQFDAASYTVNETDGTLTVNVLRVGDSSAAATVDFSTADGTAMQPGDYGSVAQTLSFGQGETSKTVVIPITDDNLIEGPETFTLNLTNATGANIVLGTPIVSTVTIVDDAARTIPTNLRASVVSANQVSLIWTDNSANEAIFSIERQDGPTGDFRQIAAAAANTTTFNDRSAQPGIQYTYRVRGQLGLLTTSYSNTATVTIGTVQFGATAYVVAETAGTVLLTVTRNGDTTSPVSVIYATADGSAKITTDYVGATSAINFAAGETTRTIPIQIVDNELLEGDHSFTVTLSNPIGSGLVLNTGTQTTVTITDDVNDLAPTNLTATPLSSTSISLSWKNPCTNATSFAIDRAIGGGPFGPLATVAVSAGTSYTDTGLAKSQGYIYRVRAVNALGQSANSNLAGATTLSDGPAAPTGLRGAAISSSEIQLFWTDNSTNETGFLLTRTDANHLNTQFALNANTVSFIDQGLIPGQSYQYSVVAVSDDVSSNAAGPITVTIPAPPRAPGNLTAIGIGPNQVLLKWTASDATSSYTLSRKAGSSAYAVVAALAPGTTSYVDGTVSANVTYTYQLVASGIGGDSPASNEATVTISLLGKLQVSPANLKFGALRVAANTTKTFTIRNTGKGVLTGAVNAPSVGTAFSITSGAGLFALAPGQAIKVTVRFLPRAAGSFSDGIVISSTDRSHDSVRVSLSGSAR